MSDKPIRILIVDDQELIRSGYKAIFSTYPDFEIVGVANDGAEAVSLSQKLRPDVVLMDIRMPEMDGIEATRAIAANPLLKDTHVLVLTTFDIDSYVYDALSAGASGFLLKDSDPDEMARAIRIVANGNALIEPSVMKRLIQQFSDTGSTSSKSEELKEELSQLTDREQEILRLVAKGLSNEEIASQLFISPATVKTHLARIMSKTASHDRAQLVVFAFESGLAKVQLILLHKSNRMLSYANGLALKALEC